MAVDSGAQQERTTLDGVAENWGARHRQSRVGDGSRAVSGSVVWLRQSRARLKGDSSGQWRGATVRGWGVGEMQGTCGGSGYQVCEGREVGLGMGGSGSSSARRGGGGGGGGGLMELGQLKSRKAKIDQNNSEIYALHQPAN